MTEQRTQPLLMSKIRTPYGRCDFKRFDDIASSHMRAGRGNIGKVEVDCRFMFTKSQWGVIGEFNNPAGIIFLDLDFRQPPDCKLESATVTVTLEEEDGEEDRIEPRSKCPVKFTDHYGPKFLRGEPSLVQTRKVKNRTPEVQILGYGAGGLGVNKEKIVQTTSRWKFSAHICSSKGNIWYNRLRWELQENSLEREPTHSNLIHTAFALEHNATRFYMTVHVSGKLAKLSDKLKGRFKFKSKEEENQEIVTKIEWREGYSYPLRLDAIAQDLHPAMELQNMTMVPMELPAALPATFHTTAANSASTIASPRPTGPEPPSQLTMQPPSLSSAPQAGLPANAGANVLEIGNSGQYLPAPGLDELRAAAGLASRSSIPPSPATEPAWPDADDVSKYSGSGSDTLVGSAASTPVSESTTITAESVTGILKVASEKGRHSGSPANGVWLGLNAMLLYWVGKIGLLLLGLAGANGVHLEVQKKAGVSCLTVDQGGPRENIDDDACSLGC